MLGVKGFLFYCTDMGKIIFLLGATRSGKSKLAVKMAEDIAGNRVAFVATCIAKDNEMKRRIALHRKNRPSSWITVEGGNETLKELKKIKPPFKVVILDCLTLFVSGLMIKGFTEGSIKKKLTELTRFLSEAPWTAIVVSNEVGAGVVPKDKLVREFRDFSGFANQLIAQYASEAYLVVAGIPVKVK